MKLQNDEDFYWYCKELDTKRKYNHSHRGRPIKYPCIVTSDWGDDYNSGYYYDHDFEYQVEFMCETCGTKHLIWASEKGEQNDRT